MAAGSTARDGLLRTGLLDPGVRVRLPADLRLRVKLGWLPVQGYVRIRKASGFFGI